MRDLMAALGLVTFMTAPSAWAQSAGAPEQAGSMIVPSSAQSVASPQREPVVPPIRRVAPVTPALAFTAPRTRTAARTAATRRSSAKTAASAKSVASQSMRRAAQ
jgi:hypothetical protein